jgi:hypothetical protein
MWTEIEYIGWEWAIGGLTGFGLFNPWLFGRMVEFERKWTTGHILKVLKSNPKSLRQRGEVLLCQDRNLMRLPFLLALTVQALMAATLLALSSDTQTALWALWQASAAFWVMFALAYLNGRTRFWDNYIRQIKLTTARALVRPEQLETSEAILYRAALRKDPIVRWAAANAIQHLGVSRALKVLSKLSHDPDERVKDAAKDSKMALQRLVGGEQLLSLVDLDRLIAQHSNALEMIATTSNSRERIGQIEDKIDDIVFSQSAWRQAFPEVFCQKCRTRAEERSHLHWAWIQCTHCKDVLDLQQGVKLVIGQIGGDDQNSLREGNLRINLWNERLREAEFAEIDALEIIGGMNLPYDKAVVAVVEKLRANGLVRHMKVTLTDAPALSPDTLQSLRSLDPELKG